MKPVTTYLALFLNVFLFHPVIAFADETDTTPSQPMEEPSSKEEALKKSDTEEPSAEETAPERETPEEPATEEAADEEPAQEEPVSEESPPAELPPQNPLEVHHLSPVYSAALHDEMMRDYYSNLTRQKWGHALLGSGLGVTLVGITLIEIDSWGSLGKAGFISVGGGIGVSVIGMFLLGFSRPVQELQPSRKLIAGPTSDNRGATVGYEVYF